MPATTANEVKLQLQRIKNISEKVVELRKCVYELMEFKEVLSQPWLDIDTDYPELLDDATPTDDTPFIGENFTSTHVNQAYNKLTDLQTFLDDGTGTTGNPGKIIMRMARGGV